MALSGYIDLLEGMDTEKITGRVEKVVGLTIESRGPKASVGEICRIQSETGVLRGKVEVVGFRDNHLLLMPLGALEEVRLGDDVMLEAHRLTVPVADGILGRVLNGLGEPIDGKGPVAGSTLQPVYNQPPAPLERIRIKEPLHTGVRVIDTFLTCGKGQRTGIFAGSGIGKSILLGMIARYTSAEVNVIALIGERGREVRDFIERDLGEEGLKRSVVIVVTSDQPALLRIKGILVANAVAEYFRDNSKDVMLLVDSLSRVAMAQREIGLAVGELPTSKGYTPSVFSLLPHIVERAGNSSRGSITGFYTVLVDGDDLADPVADAVRSFLDGHVVLSRRLASLNRFPAVDILQSTSRLMVEVAGEEHLTVAGEARGLAASYEEAEDLINIGAYVRGSNPQIDRALNIIGSLQEYMKQGMNERSSFSDDLKTLAQILHPSGQETVEAG